MQRLKNKQVYLAPKNNLTLMIKKIFLENDLDLKGFIDNYKTDKDVIKKEKFNDDEIVVIFSPNYWSEISNNLNCKNIFVLNHKDNNLILEDFREFKGYDLSSNSIFNTFEVQKIHWSNHLKDCSTDIENFGYEWGNPEDANDKLGDYLSINKKLNSIIDKDTHILEIGTLGGKWTNYMLDAKKIICVDIDNFFIDFIKNRFSKYIEKFEFYVSSGNELQGIKDKSIDVIFCMDTLVRVPKEYIFDYIKEMARVLKDDAKAIIHLPNSDIQDCVDRDFTKLSTDEIEKEFQKYFKNFTLDSKTIVHGTLVYINC